MKRIYHHHEKWEEVKYNMYGDSETKDKKKLIQQVINYFNNKSLVETYMAFVVDNFQYSCEHIFTNPNMNRIAWLGQSSVAVWEKIPREITMIAWNYLNLHIQERANQIAQNEIDRWESCQNNI